MISFIRRYWKYLTCALIVLVTLVLGIFYYQYNNSVSTPPVKKLSLTKEKEEVNTVFVDVKGAVNAPGVYELDDGKRVIDVINLAGGLREDADTINLNLSKKLADEAYIVIYTKEEIYNYKKNNQSNSKIECASFECVCPDKNNDACIVNDDKKTSNAKKEESVTVENKSISINNATKEELMNLPGIGESRADAIIKYRQENGNFKTLEEIKNVSGIGDALYEKIKVNVVL